MHKFVCASRMHSSLGPIHRAQMSCIDHVLQVSKVEFMMFILENLNLVGREEMGKILELFESVDHDGDGILSLAVALLCSLAFHSLHSLAVL